MQIRGQGWYLQHTNYIYIQITFINWQDKSKQSNKNTDNGYEYAIQRPQTKVASKLRVNCS